MKKTYISLMALLSLGLVVTSCSNDDEVVVNPGPVAGTHIKTFNATQEGADIVTRTSIEAVYSDDKVSSTNPSGFDGYKINWTAGDEITVYDGTTTKKTGTISNITSDKTGATIASPVADGAMKFTAVYPQSVGDACTYSEKTVSGLVIPASQKATLNSYDPAAAIMTAYLDQTDYGEAATERKDELKFTNVCSFIKLTTNKAYKSIKVSVTSGTLSGSYKSTDVSAIAPSFAYESTSVLTADQAVTLNPASPATTIAAGTYYICVAPNASIAGLQVDCTTSDDKVDTYKPVTDSKLIRNVVYDLGELGYGVSVENGVINIQGTNNIATLTVSGVHGSNAAISASVEGTLLDDKEGTIAITKVPSDGIVYVKAAQKGTATITVGSASATVEVCDYRAEVYKNYSGSDATDAVEGSETKVYLKVTDETALITDLTRVVISGVSGATVATTDTKGIYEITCPSGYSNAAFKVTYYHTSAGGENVEFPLLNKTVPAAP